MTAERYVLRTLGGRWAYLFIYDTRAEMLRAARRWNGVDYGDDTEGLQQGFNALNANRYLGHLRANRDDLTLEVLLHECVHLAIDEVRRTIGFDGLLNPDDEDREGEETLTHAVAYLQAQAFSRLTAAGYQLA